MIFMRAKLYKTREGRYMKCALPPWERHLKRDKSSKAEHTSSIPRVLSYFQIENFEKLGMVGVCL